MRHLENRLEVDSCTFIEAAQPDPGNCEHADSHGSRGGRGTLGAVHTDKVDCAWDLPSWPATACSSLAVYLLTYWKLDCIQFTSCDSLSRATLALAIVLPLLVMLMAVFWCDFAGGD